MESALKDRDFCTSLIRHIRSLEDRRQPIKRVYPLEEIVFLGFCGVCCGCEGWDEIRFFGESRAEFLREYLPYADGIPSASTIARAFGIIPPETFENFFNDFFGRLLLPRGAEGLTIAIDGKTARGSGSKDKKALHALHACIAESGLLLGYKTIEGKTNEIPTLPQLLDAICVEGAVVTTDAMGCQRETCRKIAEQGGDYVICLKGNQGTLHKDVELLFRDMPEHYVPDVWRNESGGHGRVELRETLALPVCNYLKEAHNWPHLASVASVRRVSYDKTSGKESQEIRYFISSLPPNAAALGGVAQEHWKVESLHWQLDVSWREDSIHISLDCAAQNLACLRRTAHNLFKAHQNNLAKKISLKRLQKMCMLNPRYLKEIISLENYLNANS